MNELRPLDIRQAGPERLAIDWSDGKTTDYRVFDLRVNCPCANCRDEITGKRILDPATVPPRVHPKSLESVGNYAIKIVWSDGHDTGIYTYDRLRTLA